MGTPTSVSYASRCFLGTVFCSATFTVQSLRGQTKSRRRVLPDTCQQGTNEKIRPMTYLRYVPLFICGLYLNASYLVPGSEQL